MNSSELQQLITLRMGRRAMVQLTGTAAALYSGLLAGCATPPEANAPLTEEEAYALGMEAYVFGYPLIYFSKLQYTRMTTPDPVSKEVARWGTWMHRRAIVTPSIPGAPQVDSMYSNLWLDLSKEPYILSIPAAQERYWSIQCCDFLGTTYGLPNHLNLPRGGNIALVGPDWNGTLPKGLDGVYRSEIPQTFGLLRTFFASQEDQQVAIRLQDQFRIASLSAWTGGSLTLVASEPGPLKPWDIQSDPLADVRTWQRRGRGRPPACGRRSGFDRSRLTVHGRI